MRGQEEPEPDLPGFRGPWSSLGKANMVFRVSRESLDIAWEPCEEGMDCAIGQGGPAFSRTLLWEQRSSFLAWLTLNLFLRVHSAFICSRNPSLTSTLSPILGASIAYFENVRGDARNSSPVLSMDCVSGQYAKNTLHMLSWLCLPAAPQGKVSAGSLFKWVKTVKFGGV